MYKSKLQEFCQSKKWNLPVYSTAREGYDHCPLFKATVVVNGSSFSTHHPSKSSKEAQNLAAQIAFEHFNVSSSGADTGLQVSLTFIDTQQPKLIQPLQVSSSTGLNSPNKDDNKVKDMAHLYKNQLQIYAQKRNLNLPEYKSKREGPPHAPRFESIVILEGKTYESLEYYSTLKDAENAAAKTALMSVTSDGTEEEDPGFFKNLLQELAQREYSCLPEYDTNRSGPPHNPIFVSTVEINEDSFTGQEAKTKKLAEMYAAKVAYTALRGRKWKQNSESDSPGYLVNDTSCCSSPKLHLVPVSELPDRQISASNPVSDTLEGERGRCNDGGYHQGNETKLSVGESVVSCNLGQYNCGLKVDALPFRQDLLHSPVVPACVQSPSSSGAGDISQPLASSDTSFSHKRIKVYPLTPNMTLPAGVTVMLIDEKWVAVTADTIHS